MARQQGGTPQRSFVRGLITENTAFSFPEDACVETYDCIFDRTGRVSRRPGLDVEGSNKVETIGKTTNEHVSEYRWEAPAGNGDKTFMVVAVGNLLKFYDISSSTEIYDNLESFTVDLDSFVPEGSSNDPATETTQFASGNGDLFVTNPAVQPFYVRYDNTNDTISAVGIAMRYRDFAIIADGYLDDERPSLTVSGMSTNQPRHAYNVYNQGFYDYLLDQWDGLSSDMPSRCDTPAAVREGELDNFSLGKLAEWSPSTNSLAARGHFILDVFAPDRVAAFNDDEGVDQKISVPTDESIRLPYADGVVETDLDTRTYKINDGFTFDNAADSAVNSVTATNVYAGKEFAAARPMYKVRWVGSDDNNTVNGTNDVTFNLRAANTQPTNYASDGTSLASVTNTSDADKTVEMVSSDTTTNYRWWWVYVTYGSSTTFYLTELEFYAPPGESDESIDVDTMRTYERPTSCAFYAQRIWYAGTDTARLGSNIYYSQLIFDRDQYGKCYQENDPTSERVFDLLATDGGVIKIPEMGKVIKLFTYQASLLIFAKNGVWEVRGGTAGFKANDFLIRKVSSVAPTAPTSITDMQGIPYFWAEDSISTIAYDFENDSFQRTPLTDDSIKSFITDIPEFNRQFAKGAYDLEEQKIYFLFNSGTVTAANAFTYDRVLVHDLRSQAWYPWTIGDNDLDVRGIFFAKTADGSSSSKIKLIHTETVDASNQKIGFADYESNNIYHDWTQYAVDNDDSAQEVDYTSYFETGYAVHGDGIKRFQPTYITVFMEVAEGSGLKMQGHFDWASNSNSNKYSTLQQCYNDCHNTVLENRVVSRKRLKVRGNGFALSLRFQSETDKPFTCIGWSTFETANASP